MMKLYGQKKEVKQGETEYPQPMFFIKTTEIVLALEPQFCQLKVHGQQIKMTFPLSYHAAYIKLFNNFQDSSQMNLKAELILIGWLLYEAS